MTFLKVALCSVTKAAFCAMMDMDTKRDNLTHPSVTTLKVTAYNALNTNLLIRGKMVVIKHVKHVQQTRKRMQIEVHAIVHLDLKEIQQIKFVNVLKVISILLPRTLRCLSVNALYVKIGPISQI